MTPRFDYLFTAKLDGWTPFRSGYRRFFTTRETELLAESERTFDSASRTVALLAFENEYASLGGLSVVTRFLPRHLLGAGEKVVFVTPYHSNHVAVKEARRAGKLAEEFTIPFECGGDFRRLSCLKDVGAPLPSYFLAVDGRFTAEEHPYAYSDPASLLADSLVFCVAVPYALARLGITRNILFHANDWETAAVALSSKISVLGGIIESAKAVLTLHNSYDAALPNEIASRYFSRPVPAPTVLCACIPLLNAPLATVSAPFAHELRADPLQRGCFVDHLQAEFSRNPPVGIENGTFGGKGPAFSPEAITRFASGDARTLVSEKNKRVAAFWSRVSSRADKRIIGGLSRPAPGVRVPVFFLSGRIDFLQKGFDVAFSAFERLRRGSAKLFFSPNAVGRAEAGGPELEFFGDIARRCEGDIAIWPFYLPHDEYRLLLRGAGFLVMPSFYEPFGAATEGLSAGTPVVARATGGLWMQIHSYAPVHVPSFYGDLFEGVFAGDGSAPNGLLFRERYPDALSEEEWKRIFSLPLSERGRSPLYEAMVQAAFAAFDAAVKLYADERAYTSLVAAGAASADAFAWPGTVEKYRKIYDAAARSAV
jgi:glycogen synthase